MKHVHDIDCAEKYNKKCMLKNIPRYVHCLTPCGGGHVTCPLCGDGKRLVDIDIFPIEIYDDYPGTHLLNAVHHCPYCGILFGVGCMCIEMGCSDSVFHAHLINQWKYKSIDGAAQLPPAKQGAAWSPPAKQGAAWSPPAKQGAAWSPPAKQGDPQEIFNGMPTFKNREDLLQRFDNIEIIEWICTRCD
jgi:hypothetical protein